MEKLNVDKAKLIQIVEECPKQRFEIRDGMIRANKVHSGPAPQKSFAEREHRQSVVAADSPFNREGNSNAWRPRNPPRSNTMPSNNQPRENAFHNNGDAGNGEFSRRHTTSA